MSDAYYSVCPHCRGEVWLDPMEGGYGGTCPNCGHWNFISDGTYVDEEPTKPDNLEQRYFFNGKTYTETEWAQIKAEHPYWNFYCYGVDDSYWNQGYELNMMDTM